MLSFLPALQDLQRLCLQDCFLKSYCIGGFLPHDRVPSLEASGSFYSVAASPLVS